MGSDENRGKNGGRVKETPKHDSPTVKKGTPGDFGAMRQKPMAEICHSGPFEAPGTARPRHLSVKSDLADQIGARLRIVYDDVLVQPVPDRFLELLRELESAPGASFARAKKDAT